MKPAEVRIGQWVRDARCARGWSREVLAELSGYSVATIARLEAGSGTCALAACGSIVDALGGRMEVRYAANETALSEHETQADANHADIVGNLVET